MVRNTHLLARNRCGSIPLLLIRAVVELRIVPHRNVRMNAQWCAPARARTADFGEDFLADSFVGNERRAMNVRAQIFYLQSRLVLIPAIDKHANSAGRR